LEIKRAEKVGKTTQLEKEVANSEVNYRKTALLTLKTQKNVLEAEKSIGIANQQAVIDTLETKLPKATVSGTNILETKKALPYDGFITISGNSQNVLPNEYQEVEYIESTGTQYINLNYVPTANLSKVETRVERLSMPTQYGNIFGSELDGTNRLFLRYENDGTRISFFKPWRQNYDNPESGIIDIIVDFPNRVLKIGSQTYADMQYSKSGNLLPWYLFSLNYKGNTATDCWFGGRMYYFKLYENNELIKNMIPCYRKSDNEIGMYDLVTNTFFTNAGTETFNKGNDIQVEEGIEDITIKITNDTEEKIVNVDLKDNKICKLGNIKDQLNIATGELTKRIGKNEDGTYYVLENEEIIQLDACRINILEGVNNIEIISNIPPSETQMTYFLDKRDTDPKQSMLIMEAELEIAKIQKEIDKIEIKINELENQIIAATQDLVNAEADYAHAEAIYNAVVADIQKKQDEYVILEKQQELDTERLNEEIKELEATSNKIYNDYITEIAYLKTLYPEYLETELLEMQKIKTTDWRSELYLQGVSSEPFGLESNYYYTELANE
jgi:hypothetical protein